MIQIVQGYRFAAAYVRSENIRTVSAADAHTVDTSSLSVVWIVVLCVAAAVIILLVVCLAVKRKKKKAARKAENNQ